MKCQFCGKDTKKIFAGPNDIALCEDCNNVYENANKAKEEEVMGDVVEMKNNVVEKEKVDTAAAEEPVENPIRCELVIGVLKDGRLYFNVHGDGADLLVIDGLIKYAERRMRQQWDIRDMELARAAQNEAAKENTEQ